MKTFYLLLLVALLSSCQPRTHEDCRRRCLAILEDLATELESINSRERLQQRLPRIRRLYTEIAQLMILAGELGDLEELSAAEETPTTRRLQAELIRVYRIDGARAMLDGAQTDAIALLEK